MHACNTYRNMTRGTSDIQESSGAQENGSLPASCGATRAQALADLLPPAHGSPPASCSAAPKLPRLPLRTAACTALAVQCVDKEEIISGRKESVGAWWDFLSLALPFLACMMSQKVSYDEDYHRGGLWCLLIHASSATTFEQKG